MQITDAHRTVAKKLIFQDAWDEIPVTDSLLNLIALTFTEEEAQVVAVLKPAPARVRSVARRVGRPGACLGAVASLRQPGFRRGRQSRRQRHR